MKTSLIKTSPIKTSFVATVALTLGLASSAFACEAMLKAAKAPQELGPDAVAALLSAPKSQFSLVDANNAETRAKHGVIAGAILLSNYETYDVAKELPADKAGKLIFYCGGERCSAAPTAAKKAIEAGYTDVAVMKVGIKGWVAAGKPVAKVQS